MSQLKVTSSLMPFCTSYQACSVFSLTQCIDSDRYTTEDDNITTNVSSSTTGPSTSISTSLLAPTADSSHLHSSISAKTLGGVVGGCIFVLIFIISASLCLQRMRRIKSREFCFIQRTGRGYSISVLRGNVQRNTSPFCPRAGNAH